MNIFKKNLYLWLGKMFGSSNLLDSALSNSNCILLDTKTNSEIKGKITKVYSYKHSIFYRTNFTMGGKRWTVYINSKTGTDGRFKLKAVC